jgi:hypothetical protein
MSDNSDYARYERVGSRHVALIVNLLCPVGQKGRVRYLATSACDLTPPTS